MMPSATELTYFLEIASTQNISRASERLGIAQPSLSLAIKRLEDHVHAPLLVRSKTGVKLTRAGLRFQNTARELLDHWQQVLQTIKRDESEIAGSYRIGAHVSVMSGKMAKATATLLSQYPKLEIVLHHDLSRKITDKVIAHDLDFGVVVNPISHPDLVIRKLYDDEIGFFKSPDLTAGHPNSNVLCYDPDLLQARSLLKVLRENGITFERSLHSGSLELLAEISSFLGGIAILPKRVAMASRYALEQHLPHLPTYKDVHALIYRADAQSSIASKLLARALEQILLVDSEGKNRSPRKDD